MRTIDYLTGDGAWLFWPGVIAGAAIAVQCAALSVLVVLRRMSFIGQGISHAALGGVGVAAAIGVMGDAMIGVAALVCVGAALGIGLTTHKSQEREDTAIGVFLVASMAAGAILIAWRAQNPQAGAGPLPSWESLLFGSILSVGARDAAIAWVSCALVVGLLFWFRRPMLFWAFDEPSARVFGSASLSMRLLLLTLLALAIVVAMRLSGVVLATALLVLPGATALRLSKRLWPVVVLSLACALAGMLAGLVLSFELDLPPGACVVAAMTGLYAAAWGVSAVRG